MTRRVNRPHHAAFAGALALSTLVAPSIGAAMAVPVAVTKTGGSITAYTADGTRAAFATSTNSASCPAPAVGVQQVSEVGLGTRTETLLKSYPGCDAGVGPGVGARTDRWLALSATTAYWLDGTAGATNTYSSVAAARPGIAARFSSAAVATLYASGVGPRTIGTGLGPLVAGGGSVAVNQTTTDFVSSTGCNAFGNGTGGLATDCALVVTASGALSVSALPSTSTLFETPRGTTSTLLDVSGQRLLLRDASGALALVTGTVRTELRPGTASAGAIGSNLVVGLRRTARGGALTYWDDAGRRTGSCAFLTGGVLARVAVRGRVAVYATRRGLFAVHAASSNRRRCGAHRLVTLGKGRLVSFALTPGGGLSYAVNIGAAGTIFRLTPAALRSLGYIV